MVNAIAPNAPIGATFMMTPTIAKNTCEIFSMKSNTSVPRPPNLCRQKPNNTANSNTCRISPFANASTTVFGITLRRNSVVLCICPGLVYAATAFVSSVAGSTFIPAPGWTTLTIVRPTSSAMVLTISKYSSA